MISGDMDFSEACDKLIKIIQTKDDFNESYALMLMNFIQALEGGETMRMSLAIAKKSLIADIDESLK